MLLSNHRHLIKHNKDVRGIMTELGWLRGVMGRVRRRVHGYVVLF